MYLKCHTRFKDGKEHHYWSIEEKIRCRDGRTVDRHILYLGAINDDQRADWIRCIEAFDEEQGKSVQLALFPEDKPIPEDISDTGIQICLYGFRLHRPRQWGMCWIFVEIWNELHLDSFWKPRLVDSREGTSWYHILMVLTAYRLIDPGSEWRLHRLWYERSAMGDLLGEDFSLAAKDNLYRCLDKLITHKEDLFSFLHERWQDLFGLKYDILLYDLTSTYFEIDPRSSDGGKRKFGYSRDHRSDCVQVVIALVVTPEGFPLAYETLPGNTVDNTTLRMFLDKIQNRYGKARRVWIMDRGIPTDKILKEMRESDPPIQYLVGTPKGRLSKLEAGLTEKPWKKARKDVRVKLLSEEQELYVYVESANRVQKERSMRKRRMKRLWNRLKTLQTQRPTYETLLLKIGAAKKDAGRVQSLIEIFLPEPPEKGHRSNRVNFSFRLNRSRLKEVRRREGRYLLRSNLTETDPSLLWNYYLQLTEVEAAFKNLKGDLAVRPVYHQLEERIEAHIFVSFLAYCIHCTLKEKLRQKAPGLTVRQCLDKMKGIEMLDVHFPTTDGRELIFTRYTEPEKDQLLLLSQLKLQLPVQPPPKISAKKEIQM